MRLARSQYAPRSERRRLHVSGRRGDRVSSGSGRYFHNRDELDGSEHGGFHPTPRAIQRHLWIRWDGFSRKPLFCPALVAVPVRDLAPAAISRRKIRIGPMKGHHMYFQTQGYPTVPFSRSGNNVVYVQSLLKLPSSPPTHYLLKSSHRNSLRIGASHAHPDPCPLSCNFPLPIPSHTSLATLRTIVACPFMTATDMTLCT